MSLWVRVHWSVGVVHWWSVEVVHALLISLIGWVHHKLVYTSVSILWLLMLVEVCFFILWQSTVALYLKTFWVEWCLTVSFLSPWVVVNCVPLESSLVVILVSCEGLVSQSESFTLSLCNTLVLSLFESVIVIVSLSMRLDSLWQWVESSLGVLPILSFQGGRVVLGST